MANTSILAAFERMWQHVVAVVGTKSDLDHNHDDKYYTESEIDSKLLNKADTNHNHDESYDLKGSADDALAESKEYTDTVASGKANTSHTHSISNVTNLQTSLDEKVPTSRTVNGKALSENITLSASDVGADAKGSASDALASAKSYTDTKTSGLASTSTVDTKISTHNTSTSAHSDIRDLITGLTTRLNTLADSDDTTLDQMSEIVEYIKANKSLIDSITTSKVNVSDIVNNLTTNVTNKPLSAAQGVAIKNLIDALQTAVDSKADSLSDLGVTATATELNYMDGVTSNVQTQLDGKAASSHSHTITASASDDDVVVLTGTNGTNKVTYSASHANSGVTAGTYKSVTVNAKGHVTGGTNPTTLSGYGITDAYTKTQIDSTVSGLNTAISGKAASSHGHAISDITNLQSSLDGKASSSHTHNYAGSSSAGGAATSANKVNNSLTVKLNSGTTEGTNMFTFNGSAAKAVNITPSAIGAAASSHTHDDRYYTESEVDTKLSGKANSSHSHNNYASTVTTTGSGNAITDITQSGNTITAVKNTTFLTAHPTISKSTDSTSTGNVVQGGTFTAIDSVTRDSNGHVTKVNTKTLTVKPYIHTADASGEQAGYLKIATFTVTKTYQNQPITLEVVKRGSDCTCKLYIYFSNESDNDPASAYVRYTGQNYNVYIHKSAASTFDLYVKKDAYNCIDVLNYYQGYYSIGTKITWKNELVTAVPDGAVLATLTGNVSYAASAGSATSATSATKATQDASGNTITSTYATKTELNTAKTNLQASIDGKANSSHSHNYAGSSSAGGSATSAVKLATARSIGLSQDFQGSANFDGTSSISIPATNYHETINSQNTNNYPYHRIASAGSKAYPITGSWNDIDAIFCIRSRFSGGGYGIIKVSLRTNGSDVSSASANWLVRHKYPVEKIKIGLYNVHGATYADIYFKADTYARTTVTQLEGGRSWTLIESSEVADTTTSDKKGSVECYTSIESAATTIHGQDYSRIITATDGGVVGTATKVGATTVGSATQPVYINNGTPTNCTYTLGASVPSGAKFTDTTYSAATQSAAGLMSADDKTQIDYGGIPIVTTAGSGSAYTATIDGITSLKVGTKITIIPHVISAAYAPTLNVNSLGAKAIRMPVSYSSATTANGSTTTWLAKDKPVTLEYNGTYWLTIGLTRPSADYLSGTVPVANGGTGGTTAAEAKTNLGFLTSSDFTVSNGVLTLNFL